MRNPDDLTFDGHAPRGDWHAERFHLPGVKLLPRPARRQPRRPSNMSAPFTMRCAADPGSVSARAVVSAKDTAAEWLYTKHRDLARKTQARETVTLIPTQDGCLIIEPDGRIRVQPIDASLGGTYCVPARIDWSRLQDDHYIPAPVPPDSALGIYLDRFFPLPLIPEDGEEDVRNLLRTTHCVAP